MSLKDKVLMQPEHQAVLGSPLEFVDIATMLDSDIPPPPILIDDLVYADGQVHTLSGHPGCGKTTLAMWFAHHELSQGRHVTWLDFESGTRQTARRLQAVGVTGAMARDRLHYAQFPGRVEHHFEVIGQRWPGALVVVDSMAKALSAAGLKENENDDVTGWGEPLVKACKLHQFPVVIIDHITKGGAESPYARGGGGKLAADDVHWRVENTQPFNRRQSGEIKLSSKKDREGFLAFNQYFKVGDGAGRLTLLPTAGPADEREDDDGSKPAI